MRPDQRPNRPTRQPALIGTLMAAIGLLVMLNTAAAGSAAATTGSAPINCAAIGPAAANVAPSATTEPKWQTSQDPTNPDKIILISPFDCDGPTTPPSGSTSTEPTSTATEATTSEPVTSTTASATTSAPGTPTSANATTSHGQAGSPDSMPQQPNKGNGLLSWTGAGPLLLLAAVALALLTGGAFLSLLARRRSTRRSETVPAPTPPNPLAN